MKVASAWRKWVRAGLDLLYPRSCPACLTGLFGRGGPGQFCRTCSRGITRIRAPFCSTCSEPFTGAITSAFDCPKCLEEEYAFDFAICPVLSKGPVRQTIHRFKYGREITLRRALARLMRPKLRDPRLKGVPWLLVPVPLHPRKERERDFNQSAELAHTLAALTGLRCVQALKRIRYTESQAGLEREKRLQNLKGAFAIRRMVKDRDVLLIDDVFTTGATANECARILKKDGGARRVAVLTAARA